MAGVVRVTVIGKRIVEKTRDRDCRIISWRRSVVGVWNIVGAEEGMARKKVRRGERRSSFIPPSVRSKRIISRGK